MDTTEAIHRATQYLAAANFCFASPRTHHLMEWDGQENAFRSQALNDEGLRLELNLNVYALDVVHPESGLSASFPLTGAKHFDIVNWLENERKFCGIQHPFVFQTGYPLNFEPPFTEQFVFPSFAGQDLDEHIHLVELAYRALKLISIERAVESDVKTLTSNLETLIEFVANDDEPSLSLGFSFGNERIGTKHFFKRLDRQGLPSDYNSLVTNIHDDAQVLAFLRSK